MIQSEIKEKIRRAIQKSYPQFQSVSFDVNESPPNLGADISSNAAFPLARAAGISVLDLARSLASNLETEPEFEKVEISKNGFLNFTLRQEYLETILTDIGRNESALKGKNSVDGPVLIEFVSANPTGPLHIGHGRGAALGDSLARVYRQCGIDAQSEYYVNDVGTQMHILAISVESRFRELVAPAEPAQFPENGYQGNYVRQIAQKMREANRKDFSEFPPEFLLSEIRRDLEDFGICFDRWFFESTLHSEGKVEKVLQLLESKGKLRASEGALWFVGKGAKEEFDRERVLRKSDGKYTYFAADAAYHQNKFERGFKRCIDIWGHDHHGYVARILGSMSALGIPEDRLTILLYQLVSLKRAGKKVPMSTRAGEFVTLREILDEVGRDACRFFFAMRSPTSQLEFDVDLAKKRSQENPVYYVQYLHARICSVFREAEKRGIALRDSVSIPKNILSAPAERELLKKLGFFTDVLEHVVQVTSPHPIADYLIDLAACFHRFYDQHRVLDAEEKVREARLVLLRATQKVARTALSLLGVSAPEQM